MPVSKRESGYLKLEVRKMRVAAVVLIVLAYVNGALAQAPAVSATGFITDTMCGKRGANAQHTDHAKRQVASGKAQYAIYDEASKRLYVFDSTDPGTRAMVEQFLGQRVRITGTLSATPLRSAGDVLVPADSPSAQMAGVSAPSISGAAGSAPTQLVAVKSAKALDKSTPIAGALSVTSIEPAPR